MKQKIKFTRETLDNSKSMSIYNNTGNKKLQCSSYQVFDKINIV